MNREQWLTKAKDSLLRSFEASGYGDYPRQIRVSCGWPSSGGGKANNRTIGQAWSAECSEGGVSEIFISPVLADPIRVLDVLVHELCHVVVGLEHGHKGAFKQCARAMGLEGKMTATHAGAELVQELTVLSESLGEYPHDALAPAVKVKKQGTRLRKAECSECGYTVRVTAKWLDIGAPICPCNREDMQIV